PRCSVSTGHRGRNDAVYRTPALWCLLAALLCGAPTPAAKALLGTIPPITLAGLLYLGAALAVLPFSLQGGSAALRRGRANLGRLLGAVVLGGAVAPVLLLVGLSGARAASVALWLNLEVVTTAGYDWRLVLAALTLGAFSYGLSLVLYVSGAQQMGAARSQMLFAASPFLGAALSWAVLGEPVQPLQLVAALVMLAGIGLLLSSRHAHVHSHAEAAHTHSHRHDDSHHDHRHPGLPVETCHSHPHTHEPFIHAHPHAPDLHHRHGH